MSRDIIIRCDYNLWVKIRDSLMCPVAISLQEVREYVCMSSLFSVCGLLHFQVRAENYAQLISCDVRTLLGQGLDWRYSYSVYAMDIEPMLEARCRLL